jgi:hypothetical protein
MYVHVFGAFFGLAVAKVLNSKEVESKDESSNYHSDLFSMIGKNNFKLIMVIIIIIIIMLNFLFY